MKTHQQFAKRLSELLDGAQAVRITVPEFLPLVIEDIGTTAARERQISIAHYGQQNGDAMRDPEMIFDVIQHPTAPPDGHRLLTREASRKTHRDYRGEIDGQPAILELGASGATVLTPVCIAEIYAEPVYFRNDYAGLEQWVYDYTEDGRKTAVQPRLKSELTSFARTWFRNLRAQGFFDRDAKREVLG